MCQTTPDLEELTPHHYAACIPDWGRGAGILRVQRRPACECSKPQTHGFKLPEAALVKAAVVNVRG